MRIFPAYALQGQATTTISFDQRPDMKINSSYACSCRSLPWLKSTRVRCNLVRLPCMICKDSPTGILANTMPPRNFAFLRHGHAAGMSPPIIEIIASSHPHRDLIFLAWACRVRPVASYRRCCANRVCQGIDLYATYPQCCTLQYVSARHYLLYL